jgi:hypothetical protein
MPQPPEANIADLIRSCFMEWSDQKFAVFCSTIRPSLEAALTRFTGGRELVDTICGAALADYQRTFQSRFRPKFDYETYFLAIAYSHLVRMHGDWGVQSLLRRMFGYVPDCVARQDLPILVFSAVLRMPHDCLPHLLESCFRTGIMGWEPEFGAFVPIRPLPKNFGDCCGRLKCVLEPALG